MVQNLLTHAFFLFSFLILPSPPQVPHTLSSEIFPRTASAEGWRRLAQTYSLGRL